DVKAPHIAAQIADVDAVEKTLRIVVGIERHDVRRNRESRDLSGRAITAALSDAPGVKYQSIIGTQDIYGAAHGVLAADADPRQRVLQGVITAGEDQRWNVAGGGTEVSDRAQHWL